MPVQRQELLILVKALSDPSVGRTAQRVVVSVKQIQQGLRNTQRTAQNTQNIFKRMATGITGFMRDVAATAAGVLVRDVVVGGLDVVKRGIQALSRAMIDANASFELYTTTIAAMTGSHQVAANMLGAIRKIAEETGRGFSEMVEMGQPLVRFAQGSSKALYELMRSMMLLQAIKPQAGPVAAMIAITEALSGQFRSLQMRFEIGKEKIQAVLDEGYVGVEALLEVLKREGASWELVTAQADTFRGVMTTLKGVAQDFFRIMGSAVFGQITGDLRAARDWVVKNKDAIMGLAQAIGTYLAGAYDTVIAVLTTWMGLEEGGLPSLSVEKIAQWGANLMAGLVDGILYAADQYLLPALIAIANVIATVLSGKAVPAAKKSGEEVVKAFAEGTKEASIPEQTKEAGIGGPEEGKKDLERVKKEARLRETVEKAQRRGAAMMEAAERRVAAAKEAVRQATERVREAQERLNAFTRATAEIPERFTRGRRRQLETELDAARKEEQKKQDALAQAQDMIRATQEQARALKKLVEAEKEALEAGTTFGVGVTGDIEKAGSKVEEFSQRFREMIAQTFAERGIGERWKSIQTQFETLGGSIETIGGNAWKIARAVENAAGFAENLILAFQNLPPWVKTILMGVGIVVALNVATGGLVNTILMTFLTAGLTLGPAGWTLIGAGIAIYLVIKNKDELQRTISEIFALPVLLLTQALPEGPLKEWAKEQIAIPTVEAVEEGVSPIPGILGGLVGGPLGAIAAQFLANKLKIGAAAKKGLQDPIEKTAKDLSRNLVGESIIPNMLDAVIEEYERLTEEAWPLVEEFAEDVADKMEEMSDLIEERVETASDSVVKYTGTMSESFVSLTSNVNTLRLALERLIVVLRQMPAIPRIPDIRIPTPRNLAPATMALAEAGRLAGGGGGARLNTFNINALINLQSGTKQEFMAAAERLWDEKMSRLTRRLNK